MRKSQEILNCPIMSVKFLSFSSHQGNAKYKYNMIPILQKTAKKFLVELLSVGKHEARGTLYL